MFLFSSCKSWISLKDLFSQCDWAPGTLTHLTLQNLLLCPAAWTHGSQLTNSLPGHPVLQPFNLINYPGFICVFVCYILDFSSKPAETHIPALNAPDFNVVDNKTFKYLRWSTPTVSAAYCRSTSLQKYPRLHQQDGYLLSPWQRRGPTVSLASESGLLVSPTATWLTGRCSLYTNRPESSLLRAKQTVGHVLV